MALAIKNYQKFGENRLKGIFYFIFDIPLHLAPFPYLCLPK